MPYQLNPFEIEDALPIKITGERYGMKINGEYPSYETLVESTTKRVDWTINAGTNNYQGDLYLFGESNDDAGYYYYVRIGYGSCSGCDALEACDTPEELISLRDEIKRSIIRFDTLKEFETYINDDEAYWVDDDLRKFAELMKNMYNVTIKTERY